MKITSLSTGSARTSTLSVSGQNRFKNVVFPEPMLPSTATVNAFRLLKGIFTISVSWDPCRFEAILVTQIVLGLPISMEVLANICHCFAVRNDPDVINLKLAKLLLWSSDTIIIWKLSCLKSTHVVCRGAADVSRWRRDGQFLGDESECPYTRVHTRMAKNGSREAAFIIPSLT